MRSFPVLLLAAAGLPAQDVVVPAAYRSTDAASMAGLPGIVGPRREQVLVDPAHLSGLTGRDLTGVWFRRDTGRGNRALASSTIVLTVRLSTSPRPAAEPAHTVAGNVGPDERTVFQGSIATPDAPAVARGASVAWDARNALFIPFSPPFPYGGGTLCLDVDGTAAGAASFWPVDCAAERPTATVTPIGAACGPLAIGGAATAQVSLRSLVPGGLARLDLHTDPNTPAWLLVALAASPGRLPLALIGAPADCWLHVDGVIAALPAQSGPLAVPARPEHGAFAEQVVPLPLDQNLLGAGFAVQWLTFGPTPAASNALRCRLATALPSLAMATVTHRAGAARPEVSTLRAPVLRFDYR